MKEMVDSPYHGHKIVSWAVEEKCYFCSHPASHKVTEDNIPSNYHPYTAYVCCNHFWAGCRNDDAPGCPKCRHPWYKHVQPVKNWFGGEKNVEVCIVNMGQGDPCGCKEKP